MKTIDAVAVGLQREVQCHLLQSLRLPGAPARCRANSMVTSSGSASRRVSSNTSGATSRRLLEPPPRVSLADAVASASVVGLGVSVGTTSAVDGGRRRAARGLGVGFSLRHAASGGCAATATPRGPRRSPFFVRHLRLLGYRASRCAHGPSTVPAGFSVTAGFDEYGVSTCLQHLGKILPMYDIEYPAGSLGEPVGHHVPPRYAALRTQVDDPVTARMISRLCSMTMTVLPASTSA